MKARQDSDKKNARAQFPLIHGTNSAILALLDKTDYQFMNPIDMAREYGLAPLCGEINGGGFASIAYKSTGAMSFAPLNNDSYREYSLENIIKNYSGLSLANGGDLHRLAEAFDKGLKMRFSNMHLVMFYVARLREQEYCPETLKKVMPDFAVSIENSIKLQYFLAIASVLVEFDSSACKDELLIAIRDSLCQPKLMAAVLNSALDFKGIADAPDHSSVEDVVGILEAEVRARWPKNKKPLPEKLFRPSENIQPLEGIETFGADMSYMLNKALPLGAAYGESVDANYYVFAKKCEGYLVTLKEIMARPMRDYSLRNYLESTKPYPIVVVLAGETDVPLHKASSQEMRAMAPLKLGDDIKLLATNSAYNRRKLLRYLEREGIEGVHVVLFDDLKKMRESKSSVKDYLLELEQAVEPEWQRQLLNTLVVIPSYIESCLPMRFLKWGGNKIMNGCFYTGFAALIAIISIFNSETRERMMDEFPEIIWEQWLDCRARVHNAWYSLTACFTYDERASQDYFAPAPGAAPVVDRILEPELLRFDSVKENNISTTPDFEPVAICAAAYGK